MLIASTDPIAVTITLDGQFFTLGPVIMADDKAGIIDFYPVDSNGNFMFDPQTGAWKRTRVVGDVRIYDSMSWC
jgi:hypothetical protein